MTYDECVKNITSTISAKCNLTLMQHDEIERIIDGYLFDYMQSSQRELKQELHSTLDKTFKEAYNV